MTEHPANGGGRVGIGAALSGAVLLAAIGAAVLWMRPSDRGSTPSVPPPPPPGPSAAAKPGGPSAVPVPPRAAVAPYEPVTPVPTRGPSAELVGAATAGRAEEVKKLLLAGADRPSRDAALAAAVSHCQVECVQLLLSGGASLEAIRTPGKDGRSALKVAEEQVTLPGTPCSEVVRVLELAGARKSQRRPTEASGSKK